MKTAPSGNIDQYIASFPQDVQESLQKIRGIIRKAAPDAEEAIKYQIPTFVLHGNLVHFAAFKKHIGFILRHPQSKHSKMIWQATNGQKAQSNSRSIGRFHSI